MNQTNRRTVLRTLAATALAAKMEGGAADSDGEYQLFWGDLHNHNAVGYAQGSIERTYDIARSHLDFLAFTPHAQWHDLPRMPNNAQKKWTDGFQVLRDNWEKVQKLAAANNQPGKFVSFLAYEWHSSFFGDYCIYYPGDNRPLKYFDHVKDLQTYCKDAGAFAIPHHIAYKQGWRGANFEFFDPQVSPAIEIYSEHGLSENDRGPRDYITHSNGGRWTRNTLRAALKKGIRAGVIASSDDHLGFPGAYGEGIAGIYARDLSREALLEAIWARRTIAITGDRIGLLFKLNDAFMGSMLPFAGEREIQVSVRGQEEIERIEVVKNDRVIHRHFPEDHVKPASWAGEALFRIEFGWGPWGDLGMTRTCDWDFTAAVAGGKILEVLPCFQSGPFDEDRRNRILDCAASSCRVQSYTSRRQAFREGATNAVVLRIAGVRDAVVELTFSRPAKRKFRKTLGELAQNNEIEFMGPFTSESVVMHRLVIPDLYRARFRFTDKGRRGQGDWYYVRAFQLNGHQAWSSPIWVEG